MTQFFTDFTEYTATQQPSDWTERWHTGDAASTVESSGVPTGGGSKALKIIVATDARYALSWDDVGTPTGDIEILAKTRISDESHVTTNVERMFICGSGDDTSESGYYAGYFKSGSNRNGLVKYDAATSSTLGVAAMGAGTPATGDWYWVLLRKSGTDIESLWWEDGESKPGSMDISVTDSALSGGWIGLGAFAAGTYWFDQIGVGTGGDAAPSSALVTAKPMYAYAQQ